MKWWFQDRFRALSAICPLFPAAVSTYFLRGLWIVCSISPVYPRAAWVKLWTRCEGSRNLLESKGISSSA